MKPAAELSLCSVDLKVCCPFLVRVAWSAAVVELRKGAMAALLPEGAVSHYVLLGVLHTSSQDEIRKAHRLLALKWHPDKAGVVRKAN